MFNLTKINQAVVCVQATKPELVTDARSCNKAKLINLAAAAVRDEEMKRHRRPRSQSRDARAQRRHWPSARLAWGWWCGEEE